MRLYSSGPVNQVARFFKALQQSGWLFTGRKVTFLDWKGTSSDMVAGRTNRVSHGIEYKSAVLQALTSDTSPLTFILVKTEHIFRLRAVVLFPETERLKLSMQRQSFCMEVDAGSTVHH